MKLFVAVVMFTLSVVVAFVFAEAALVLGLLAHLLLAVAEAARESAGAWLETMD